MTAEEAAAFLAAQRVVVCATNGPGGWPHLMPLWYVLRGDDIWAWTYAKSQKVRNLERDPRATLQLEEGELYHELRGVMIRARTAIHGDTDVVAQVGAEILERYGDDPLGPGLSDALRAQARKRVALQFVGQRLASWDHRKLGGVY
jgi:PPOX class probable F420-dependent enzyme